MSRKSRKARRKARREARRQRRLDRQEARQNRIEARQQGRTARTMERQETRQTAYQHGIDPNGWISDSLDSAVDGFEAFINAKGGRTRPANSIEDLGANNKPTMAGISMPMMAGLGILGFLMLKK